MKLHWNPVALTLLLFSIPACNSGDETAGPGEETPSDEMPPATVTDLHVSASTDTTVTLAWTAPGDDGDAGTAAEYDIRHALAMITDQTWDAATPAAGAPVPLQAGTLQTLTIRNPSKSDMYMAMKTFDEAGNCSDLSNVVTGSFPDPSGIAQLTRDGDNRQPCLNNGIVTWVHGDGWNEDIYLANLASPHPVPTAVTDNGGEKENPSAHGSDKIVWQGREDGADDWEVFVYQPTTIPTYAAHTDNTVPDMYPVLAGAGDFAWLQGPIMFENVMYWDETTHSEIIISDDCCPTSEFSNEPPGAHDGAVVWRSWHRAYSGPFHAYLWDGVLTDVTDIVEANIARNYSVYQGTLAYEYSGDPTKVAYWDGTTPEVVGDGLEPSLYDGKIAFTVWDGHDYEIHYWNGSQVIEITDNNVNDSQPTLWGNMIAWVGRPSGGAGQIFYTEVE